MPPEQAEAGTMPAHNGLRLDDGDRATPRQQQTRADEQLQLVQEELRALAAASKHVDLVEIMPELVELDLNPVIVLPPGQGAIAVDVRMRLTTDAPEPG